MKGLAHEVIGAGRHSFHDSLSPIVAREQNKVDVAGEILAADVSAELQPVRMRHVPVGDHHAAIAAAEHLHRFGAVACRHNFVARGAQGFAEQLQCDRIVVDGQDPHDCPLELKKDGVQLWEQASAAGIVVRLSMARGMACRKLCSSVSTLVNAADTSGGSPSIAIRSSRPAA